MAEENGLDQVKTSAEAASAKLSKEPGSSGDPSSQLPGSSSGKKKKKKKQNKAEHSATEANKQQPEKALSLKNMRNMLAAIEKESPQENPATKSWKFWDTQPVPKMSDKVDEVGVIEEDKDHVREEPFSLPPGFEWDTVDLGDAKQLEEVYKLLNENYVEDEDNMFRFDYSADFLQWALRPPGWIAEWHCGVRVVKSKKLVGFISAIPALIKVYDKRQKMVEINFLCVHKKLRSKRVAPVLIREITRRVNLKGIFQAVYTAGVVLPKPIAKCRYYHRSLNPRKLVDVKFSHLGRNQTMQRLIKLMRLPEKPLIKGFREMEPKDVSECHQLLATYLDSFSLSPIFTEEDFAHFFLSRQGIVQSYVVEDENGEITDMSSFFSLPSSIMQHPEHNMLYAAYSFYSVATKHTLKDLMKDVLIIAKSLGYDVFNALDLMENHTFLKDLKFGMGDGNLNYYLYNFKCPFIPENKVALVLQ